jgi:hypothetical protein
MSKCIIWDGAKTMGYGVKTINREKFYVHRLALEKKLNRPIRKGYCACHTCDNPACINPKHLWEGTQAENIADMISKGRYKNPNVGEGNPHAKLTEKKVKEIRKWFSIGKNTKELAKMFKVNIRTIQSIVALKLWKNI